MATATVQIEGLEKAIRNINRYGEKKQDQIVGALDYSALMIESGAKRNLTRNGSRVTSRLASSVVRQATGKFKRTVGTNVVYAAIIEFGYRGTQYVRPHKVSAHNRNGVAVKRHNKRGHSRKVNRKAKPYLFPAAEAERPELLKSLSNILRKV